MKKHHKIIVLVLGIFAAITLYFAWQIAEFYLSDPTRLVYAQNFSLLDQNGEPITLSEIVCYSDEPFVEVVRRITVKRPRNVLLIFWKHCACGQDGEKISFYVLNKKHFDRLNTQLVFIAIQKPWQNKIMIDSYVKGVVENLYHQKMSKVICLSDIIPLKSGEIIKGHVSRLFNAYSEEHKIADGTIVFIERHGRLVWINNPDGKSDYLAVDALLEKVKQGLERNKK